jgi:hypothetical protein
MAGYTKDQTIKGVKSIDNWFSNNTTHKVDWDSFIHNNVMYKDQVRQREETSPLRYDPKFIEICKDIGFVPKYQYQLMQLVTLSLLMLLLLFISYNN